MVFVPEAAVGAVGVPVKVGEASGAFKLIRLDSDAVSVAFNFLLIRFESESVSVPVNFPVSELCTKAVVASCVVFVPEAAVGAVGVPVKVGEASGALLAKPGTVGKLAVPPKSPANLIIPFEVVVASETPPAITVEI